MIIKPRIKERADIIINTRRIAIEALDEAFNISDPDCPSEKVF